MISANEDLSFSDHDHPKESLPCLDHRITEYNEENGCLKSFVGEL